MSMYNLRTGGSDIVKGLLERAGRGLYKTGCEIWRLLGLYLDDILLLAGGGLAVRGVYELTGRKWALLTAGILLMAYAVVVARAKRGEG